MINGRKIKELREAEGLLAMDFGEKVSASQTMISHIENGIKQPSAALLKRIADYFGCTVDELYVQEPVVAD